MTGKSDGPARGSGSAVEFSLDSSIREEIYEHVFSSLEHEVGGVLLGPKTDSGPVEITARIEALEAENRQASVTFTHDSWSFIYETMDKDFPDLAIVGWYHSHPNFGIFLSEQDLFIHRNFFPGERQVAYVVDPRRGSEGVFGWVAGDIEKLYEEDTRWKPRPLEHDTADSAAGYLGGTLPSRSIGSAAKGSFLKGAGILLAGLFVGGGIGVVVSAKDAVTTTPTDSGLVACLRSEVAEMQSRLDKGANNAAPSATEYKVRAQDTLSGIAIRSYGSDTYTQLLAELNGISNPDQISLGQTLKIPSKASLQALLATKPVSTEQPPQSTLGGC